MAVSSIRKSSYSLLPVLVGVLSFNLSHFPGQAPVRELAAELASSQSCSLKEQLEDPSVQEAVCPFRNGKADGTVRVKMEERQVRDLNTGEVKTKKQWKMSYEVSVACPSCAGDQQPSLKDNEYFSNPDEMDRLALDGFNNRVTKLNNEVTKVTEQAQREFLCLEKVGEEKRSDSEVLQCRIDKLNGITKPDQAAQYYQDNVEPQVQALVESDRVADRQKAVAILSKLNRSSNTFIRENSLDLGMYGSYREQVQMLSSQLSLYRDRPNDPAARNLAKQIMGLKDNWAAYFSRRYGAASTMTDPNLGNFALGQYLAADLTDYNREYYNNLSLAFANVPALHAQYLSASNAGNIPGAGAAPIQYGRNARGYESARYPYAPGGAMAQQPGNGFPNHQQPFQQFPQNGVGGNGMSPMSRMPVPGTPVFGGGSNMPFRPNQTGPMGSRGAR